MRRIACLEELRLNRRYAPEIYLDVVCILDAGDHLKVASQDESMNKRVVEYACLLYTSDAADERSSVDLGGRRIIKKKKK